MTYTSWATIENVIKQKGITKFKLLGDDESLIYDHKPESVETPLDTANTLKQYLDDLEGNNHAIIKLITDTHRGQKGGNTSATVFRYNYRLKNATRGSRSGNEFGDNAMFAMMLNMTKEMERLRAESQMRELQQQINELKKGGKNERLSSLEKVALQIGKGLYSELKKNNGLRGDIGDAEEEIEETPAPKKEAVKQAKKAERPEANEKDFAKRSGVAIKRLAKVGGFGVANALEDIADMAESNPAKLIELLSKAKGE